MCAIVRGSKPSFVVVTGVIKFQFWGQNLGPPALEAGDGTLSHAPTLVCCFVVGSVFSRLHSGAHPCGHTRTSSVQGAKSIDVATQKTSVNSQIFGNTCDPKPLWI